MSGKESILLADFMPKSELVVDRVKLAGPKFPVIDIHGHFASLIAGKGDIEKEIGKLKALGLQNMVSLEFTWGEEFSTSLDKASPYRDFFITFGSVDVSRLEEPNFASHVEETLTEAKAQGSRGIKLWKNLGLRLKDQAGNYIRIDDPRLSPVFKVAAQLDLPILIHIADPVAFFRPIDGFNERYEELQAHPDWSFCAPDLYSFEELMEQQKNMLAQNPETTFIIAHGGSYPENLGFVGECLDKYPNMYVDIAARIAEFGRQPYTAREFFVKYQDRILFGTDAGPGWYIHSIYYEFLETWNEYIDYDTAKIPPQGRWKIYGIGLEDEVLEKIYNGNAKKLLKLE